MRYAFIEDVKQGDILAKTIFNDDCNVLLTANSYLTDKNIEKIKFLGFKGLYIYDDNHKDEYIDLLSDDIRQQSLRHLKHINIDDCLFVANAITNSVLENPNMMYEMMNICSYDNYTYMHSINVSILATMIGVDMRMSNNALKELSQAGLFHDIGKMCVPSHIINKTEKLTDDEFETMKLHPRHGYMLLSKNNLISETVRMAILHHHENEDGTGYPMNLRRNAIPVFSKIIHAADVYDAMISKRSYKNRINPADVLEYLMGNTEHFDINVIKSLINCVTLYPIGSIVQLSNGLQATVVKNAKGYPQRPVVKTVTGEYIDMMTELNITITSLIS